jgi:hypothetical protein
MTWCNVENAPQQCLAENLPAIPPIGPFGCARLTLHQKLRNAKVFDRLKEFGNSCKLLVAMPNTAVAGKPDGMMCHLCLFSVIEASEELKTQHQQLFQRMEAARGAQTSTPSLTSTFPI